MVVNTLHTTSGKCPYITDRWRTRAQRKVPGIRTADMEHTSAGEARD